MSDDPAKKNIMADGKGGFFSKTVQKHAGRAKERILQNLGKADKTRDELFDEYLNNFNKQQNAANKLHKEIRHYMSCIKEMQAANKSLFETLISVYDPEWLGHEQLYIRSQHIDMVWNDYSHKLNDQIMIPLQTYLNQFPDIKEKIGKRGRKLVDYDRQRHNFEALQNNPKKRDDVKISKCKEQLDEAKKMYEILNNELHDDLPALYDSRIPFMVSNFQTVFTAETVFHNEESKVYAQLVDMMEKLAIENQKGTYMQRKTDSPSQKRERTYEEIDVKQQDGGIIADSNAISAATTNGEEELDAESHLTSPKTFSPGGREDLPRSSSPSAHTDDSVVMHETTNDSFSSCSLTATTAATPTATGDLAGGNKTSETEVNFQLNSSTDNKNNNNSNKVSSPTGTTEANQVVNTKKVEELYDIPVGATTTDLPEGVLFRVKSTYKYVGEDNDELSLEPGEIVQVIEYNEPEEQEDGWLMGIKEETGQKGLFPANFTRPI